MHIAMIGQKGLPAIHGGVERHVHELSTGLVQAGHDVHAYARTWYTPVETTIFEGVNIVHTKSINTKHFDTITHTLTATIDAIKRNVDVIHYHGVGPSLLAWIPRVFAPHIRVIGTFHSIDRKHAKWNLFARLVLRIGEWAVSKFPHETISVSETIAGYVRDVYGANSTYIPNGVPTLIPTTETDMLAEWKLHSKQYFLIVSRLIPHKGIHDAIRAYQVLEALHPEITKSHPLVIVGDGHHTDSYSEQLKEMAMGSNIIFTGFQSGATLEQLFSHATLFIHPSEHEGLPITVLEALSYGTPTIVSDILEHRLIIPHLKYRFSKDTLADTIVRVLGSYQQLQRDTRDLQAHIRYEFAWSTIIPSITELYEEKGNEATVPTPA